MSTTPANSPFLHRLTFLTLFLLLAFGLWTGLVWLGYVGDWSFNQLRDAAWLLLPLLILLVPLTLKATRQTLSTLHIQATGGSGFQAPWLWLISSIGMLTVSLLMTVGQETGSFNLQWVLLAASCTLLVIPAYRMGNGPPPSQRQRNDLWPYLASAGLLVIAYLLSTNTDADDTHFIAAALSLLEYPNTVLFSHDTLFGESELFNHIYLLNRGQSWEALIALLSQSTGIDHLHWYYAILPILALLMVPVPLALLLKRYTPNQAWAGVLFALAFLLAWSTYNHHAGHFFVPRMFQGKSIFVALWVPAIFLATRLLVLRPGWVATLTLALVLIGGGGLTSSALYIGIAAAGTAWLAGALLNPQNALRSGLLLAVACAPNLLMLADVYQAIHSARGMAAGLSSLPPPPLQTKNASLFGQFGGGKMLAAFIVMVWLSFAYNLLLRHNPQRREQALLLGMIVLLVFNRPLSELLATMTGIDNVNWRLHWAMPLSLILALVFSNSLQLATEWRQRPLLDWLPTQASQWVAPMVPLLALLGLTTINASYLKDKYSSSPHWLKIYPQQREALAVLQRSDLQDKVILADERVAQLLPRIQHPARLISAGDLYWRKPYFNSEETWQRYRLSAVLDDVPLEDNPDIPELLTQGIAHFGINLIIRDPHKHNAGEVGQTLTHLGFDCHPMGHWQRCERP